MNVQVGECLPDGTFDGEPITFEGNAVGVYRDIRLDVADPNDPYRDIFRLYECPDGYRVHEFLWPLRPGRSAESSLYPVVGDHGYGTYTAEEAAEKWGQYFPTL